MTNIITINKGKLIKITQVRKREINETVLEYRERMKEGDEFPLIDVLQATDVEGQYYVVDGYHRLAAICHDNVTCNVVGEGDEYDALWRSAGANRKNGLRMSRDDVREAILKLLDAFPEKNPKDIADQIGCGKTTVYDVKKMYEKRENLTDESSSIDRVKRYIEDNPIAQKYSNRRIARETGVSESTVRRYFSGASFSVPENDAPKKKINGEKNGEKKRHNETKDLEQEVKDFNDELQKDHLDAMTQHFKNHVSEQEVSKKACNCEKCGKETESPYVVISKTTKERHYFCSASCAIMSAHEKGYWIGTEENQKTNCLYDYPKDDEEFYEPQPRPTTTKVTQESMRVKSEFEKSTMHTVKYLTFQDVDDIKQVAKDVLQFLGSRAGAFRVIFCDLMDNPDIP